MKHFLIIVIIAITGDLFAQLVPESNYHDLNYRMIGPFRAGRTVGAVGIPTQPNVSTMLITHCK